MAQPVDACKNGFAEDQVRESFGAATRTEAGIVNTSAASREGFDTMALAAAVLVSLGSASFSAADDVITPSRAELVRRWDLNKDGTIDESEAEIARANMRRERREIEEQTAKKSRLFSREQENEEGPADDGELRRPGDPRRPADPLGEAFRPGGEPMPKTDDKKTGEEIQPPVRRRDLNAGRPKDPGQGRPQPPLPTGPITGGVRAGGPAVRPGYGAIGPKADLNAGRLPTGLPPVQGLRPQAGAAPFRGLVPGGGLPRGLERSSGPRGVPPRDATDQRPPLIPRPAATSAEDIGLP